MSADLGQAWVSRYRSLVERAFDAFRVADEWPAVETVQRSLDHDDVEIDVGAAISEMPRLPGETRAYQPQNVVIPLRLLRYIGEAGPLVEACVAVVRRLVAVYFADNGDTQVSSDDPEVVAAIPDERIRAIAGRLVMSDFPNPAAGGGYGEGSWTLGINSGMARLYKGVTTVDDYFGRQLEIMQERHGEELPEQRPYNVFVIMPFTAPWSQGAYDLILRASELARQEFDLIVYRADEISRPGKITDQILEALDSCDAVIADITDNNPNVLYELGYAHRAGKHGVMMNQAVDLSPFDLRDWRQVVYSTTPTLDDERKIGLYLVEALEVASVATDPGAQYPNVG